MLTATVLFPNNSAVNYGPCLKKIWGWWVGVGKAEGRVKHENSKEFSVLCEEHFWPLCGCTAKQCVSQSGGSCYSQGCWTCCCLEHSLYIDISLNLFLIKLNNTNCVFLISNSDRSKARCQSCCTLWARVDQEWVGKVLPFDRGKGFQILFNRN